MKKILVHLISDSTGETILALSKAVFSQFDGIEIKEYTWSLIKTKSQLEKLLKIIERKKGIILYTIAEENLKLVLEEFCSERDVLCIEVLDEITQKISKYLGINPNHKVGKQHAIDQDYFRRIEAINYTIAHDDGQLTKNVLDADIVILGPSRTSKSPTSMYLAYRGFKVANIPLVEGIPVDESILVKRNIFFVGLTISPTRLVEIRKNRLLSFKEHNHTSYVDLEAVKEEVINAKKICLKNNFPIIDVTKRSVEETAALIIQMYYDHQKSKK